MDEEVFGCLYPGILPGWVYCKTSRKMISKNAAVSKNTPVRFDETSLQHNSMKTLANSRKSSTEFVWQKEFNDSKEKHCFVLRYTASYSEILNSADALTEGTVTEVCYQRSLAVLVCSDNRNSLAECSLFIQKMLNGSDAKLKDSICESCQKCYIYDGHVLGSRNMREFDSVVCCLKEVSRIVAEMRMGTNFTVQSWKFLKENVCTEEKKSLPNKLSFYETKLFSSSDNSCPILNNMPVQYSFGGISESKMHKSSLVGKSYTNHLISVNKNSLTDLDAIVTSGIDKMVKRPINDPPLALEISFIGESLEKKVLDKESEKSDVIRYFEIEEENQITKDSEELCQTCIKQPRPVPRKRSSLKTNISSKFENTYCNSAKSNSVSDKCGIISSSSSTSNSGVVDKLESTAIVSSERNTKLDEEHGSRCSSLAKSNQNIVIGHGSFLGDSTNSNLNTGDKHECTSTCSTERNRKMDNEDGSTYCNSAKSNLNKSYVPETSSDKKSFILIHKNCTNDDDKPASTSSTSSKSNLKMLNEPRYITTSPTKSNANKNNLCGSTPSTSATSNLNIDNVHEPVPMSSTKSNANESLLCGSTSSTSAIRNLNLDNVQEPVPMSSTKSNANESFICGSTSSTSAISILNLDNVQEPVPMSSTKSYANENNLCGSTPSTSATSNPNLDNVHEPVPMSSTKSNANESIICSSTSSTSAISNLNLDNVHEPVPMSTTKSNANESNKLRSTSSRSIKFAPNIGKEHGSTFSGSTKSVPNVDKTDGLKSAKKVKNPTDNAISSRPKFFKGPVNEKDAAESDYVNANLRTLSKLEDKKRPTVAEQLSFNVQQAKKQKQECFVNFCGKKITQTVTEINGIRKVEIGNKGTEELGRVIVLLGATGSGKTALVNLCANFYFGAQNANEEKLFIVDSKAKTDRVTIYTFYPEGEKQMPVTVVDTPGLNDSTGAEIHDHVDALKSFLALACSQGLKINAVGFVAQAHLVRLTSSEKLVMDYVKSLFGTEIEKHFLAFVTFADNQPKPPVIEAMEQYGFKSPFFVKFNNTLLISKAEKADELDQIYWKTGMRSWKRCIKHISVMESLSNAAISSVKKEVFNKSFLSKYTENLEAEIRSLITMCRKKKKLGEYYSDKQLLQQRSKVWLASNNAYYLEDGQIDATKEIFIMNTSQLHLGKPSEFSDVVIFFLLLDKESALRNALKAIVTSFLKCINIFLSLDVNSNSRQKSLVTVCMSCDKYCWHKRVHDQKYLGTMTYKCKCQCPSAVHCSSQEPDFPNRNFISKRQLYFNAVHHIKREIVKYNLLANKWTVFMALENLYFNEPEYKTVNRAVEIFKLLASLAE